MTLPPETCPWCGGDDLQCEYVDIGVGMQQCTPKVCQQCHAVQIGPYDDTPRDAEEAEKGYYRPMVDVPS